MADQYLPRTLLIAVTGSSGTVTIPKEYAGVAVGVAIEPPSTLNAAQRAAVTFDFEVFDSEDFGQIGDIDCLGPSTLRDRFQIHAGGKIDLTNVVSPLDGNWRARLWYNE